MAAYFHEISNAKVSVTCSGSSAVLPIETIQHLYRIAQEAIHCAIHECAAKGLEIGFHAEPLGWMLRISATEVRTTEQPPACLNSQAMKYRAKAIGGNLSGKPLPNGGFEMTCTSKEIL